MLDLFLEASYGQAKEAEAKASLESSLNNLPDAVLHKLASGEMKLAYYGPSDGNTWLDSFKGTPLLQKAIELEKAELHLRMEEQQTRQQNQDAYRENDALRDELCVRRKMLELELAGAELEGGMPEEEEGLPEELEAAPEEEEEAPAPPPPPAMAAAKEAMAKRAFAGALAKGLLGGAAKGLMGAGKSVAQGAARTGAAYQRGGVMPALRTAGRSALTFAGNHPGVAAGAAGLGAGVALS